MAEWHDLPPEIRNIIYTLVLPSGRNYTAYLYRRNTRRKIEPRLLRVSREIRTEARPIWLGQNVFTFNGCLGNHVCSLPNVNFHALSVPVDASKPPLHGMQNLRWSHCCRPRTPWLDSNDGVTIQPFLPDVAILTKGNECKIRVLAMRYGQVDKGSEEWRRFERRAREIGGEMVERVEKALGTKLTVARFEMK